MYLSPRSFTRTRTILDLFQLIVHSGSRNPSQCGENFFHNELWPVYYWSDQWIIEAKITKIHLQQSTGGLSDNPLVAAYDVLILE